MATCTRLLGCCNGIIDYETGGPDVVGPELFDDDDKSLQHDASAIEHDELERENQRTPTDEERATLRLVAGEMPWAAYLIIFVESGQHSTLHITDAPVFLAILLKDHFRQEETMPALLLRVGRRQAGEACMSH
ncbi:hypothetical protein B0H11DRAFT_2004483 [Mycena galericulata]|nr:hypothetical protein B0H11DRAFT_2004483 [Mycena galericulata]